MRLYIVSDFHLCFSPKNDEERERNTDVTEFLDHLIGKADMLILAGDIFDLWYDWKSTIIKGYFPVLKKLADLNEAGCRLVFVAGNHDFWFGDFFSSYLSCKVYPESFSEVIDGKKVFVSHGDKHTSNDIRYRVFRFVLRHPIIRFIFSVLHPEIALKLGRGISRTSRSRNPIPENNNDPYRSSGLDKSAKKLADDHDLIVFGHSHTPKKMNLGNAIYINTGDWVINKSFVLIEDGVPDLQQFERNGK